MADAFTDALRDYFASALGPMLADQRMGLHFVMFPEPVGVFVDKNGSFDASLADETFSRMIADRAGQLVNGLRLRRMDSIADVLKSSVLERAVFYERQDQAALLIARSRAEFEKNLAQAKKLMLNSLMGRDGYQYLGSNATPREWLNPEKNTGMWTASSIDFGKRADKPNEPIVQLRSIDPDELRKKITGIKWPPPNLNDLIHRPGWIDPPRPILDEPNFGNRWDDLIERKLPQMFEFGSPQGGKELRVAAIQKLEGAGERINLANFFNLGLGDAKPVNEREATAASALQQAVLPDTVAVDTIQANDTVHISFEYTVVAIERPWIYTPFLLENNWYIPDARRGEMTLGAEGALDGLLSLIPMQFIALRNVVMTASFSDADVAAINRSFAIGPIGTGDKVEFQQGSMKIPGMQIIAYIDISLPPLPPRSAPSFLV